MATYKSLYNSRVILDSNRQPNQFDFLKNSIHHILSSLQLDHPYGPNLEKKDFWDEVMTLDAFGEGCNGPSSKLRDQKYLYSLCKFGKLFNQRYESDFDKFYTPAVTELTDEFFFELRNEFAQNVEYINLSEYIKNTIPSYRKFSWWTQENMSHGSVESIVETALRCGIASDWFSENYLVLRLSISEETRKAVYTPTIVDGFISPIFRARTLHKNTHPSSGKTINLFEGIDKDKFCREYVVDHNQISARNIDFFPLSVDIETIYKKYEDRSERKLLDALESFYKGLIQ